MPKVFISYSVKDEHLAQDIYTALKSLNVDTFLASISLEPGSVWKESILQNLRESKWFLLLATPSSIESDAVKHEIGAALFDKKTIIPVLHNISFDQLPPWLSEHQGIKLEKGKASEMQDTLIKIAEKIKDDKLTTALILGGLVAALLLSN